MKSRTKNLGLAGVILGTSIFSGCRVNDNSLLGMGLSAIGVHKGNPVAQVVGGQLAQYGAAQAGANNTNVYVNGANSGVPSAQTFICNYMQDFNNDGAICPVTESVGRGKVTFYTDESVTYAVDQSGCKGKTLSLYLQEGPGSPFQEALSSVIAKDHSTPQTIAIPLSRSVPGIYKSYWTLDNIKIGEHLIEVKARN